MVSCSNIYLKSYDNWKRTKTQYTIFTTCNLPNIFENLYGDLYFDILQLLKKAHLLYFIEDNLPELIMDVAKKINHIPKIIPLEQVAMHYEKYKYEFTIKLAGL